MKEGAGATEAEPSGDGGRKTAKAESTNSLTLNRPCFGSSSSLMSSKCFRGDERRLGIARKRLLACWVNEQRKAVLRVGKSLAQHYLTVLRIRKFLPHSPAPSQIRRWRWRDWRAARPPPLSLPSPSFLQMYGGL